MTFSVVVKIFLCTRILQQAYPFHSLLLAVHGQRAQCSSVWPTPYLSPVQNPVEGIVAILFRHCLKYYLCVSSTFIRALSTATVSACMHALSRSMTATLFGGAQDFETERVIIPAHQRWQRHRTSERAMIQNDPTVPPFDSLGFYRCDGAVNS
jgi:hypothetical protein